MDLVLIAFGLGVGLLVGITGVGGGSLMTPLLILILGVKPTLAIGTDLLYGAITKTLGGWRHLRLGNVDLRLSAWMGLGSLPGSLIGVRLASAEVESVLLPVLAGTLMLISLILAWSPRLTASQPPPLDLTGRLRAVAIGLAVGIVLGMTSVGSGALIGLALIVVFRLPAPRVVGTDVFHAAILLWVAGLAHWRLGHVDLHLLFNLLAGSLPGVWLGASAIRHIPAQRLRLLISMVLLASGLALLNKSGFHLSPLLILGLPAAMGLFLSLPRAARAHLPTAS